MKSLPFATLLAATMLSACAVVPERHFAEPAPPLPAVVELDKTPYYYHSGYCYYYHNNAWYYAKSQEGPWEPLPKESYPLTLRFKGRGEAEGGHQMGHGVGRGHKQGREHRANPSTDY